jgi:hypothetical protein
MEEQEVRNKLNELRNKFMQHIKDKETVEVDAYVKLSNCELWLSGKDYKFKFSILYNNKNLLICQYPFLHEIYADNLKVLFTNIYADFMELSDCFNCV